MTGESFVGRWLAEAGRRPGARLIWSSFLGLAALAAAAFYVSFRAQFAFMFGVKHQDIPALVEAVIPDAGMVICSLLALGMACAGQSARVARLLVVVFAGLSAGMNYLAADVTSFRSVAVYVMPPAAFAVCTDVAVSVVRRHGMGIREDSAWAMLGRAVLAAARLAGVILLYSLRFILAPAETAKGLRRMVLDAAPLQGALRGRPVPEAVPGAAPEVTPETGLPLTPEAIPGQRPPHRRPPLKRPREWSCMPCRRSPGSGPGGDLRTPPGSSRGQRPRSGCRRTTPRTWRPGRSRLSARFAGNGRSAMTGPGNCTRRWPPGRRDAPLPDTSAPAVRDAAADRAPGRRCGGRGRRPGRHFRSRRSG